MPLKRAIPALKISLHTPNETLTLYLFTRGAKVTCSKIGSFIPDGDFGTGIFKQALLLFLRLALGYWNKSPEIEISDEGGTGEYSIRTQAFQEFTGISLVNGRVVLANEGIQGTYGPKDRSMLPRLQQILYVLADTDKLVIGK